MAALRRGLVGAGAMILAGGWLAGGWGPAPAAWADGGYARCVVGDRVADNQGNVGTVASVEGDGTYCHVDIDGGDKGHYYIFWMLHAAGKPLVDPAQVARIVPGRYACYAGNPVQYTFMDIIVDDGATYHDGNGAAGQFSYDPATQLITFASGSFAGAYAKYLENHEIGIASEPSSFFGTVCDLQQ